MTVKRWVPFAAAALVLAAALATGVAARQGGDGGNASGGDLAAPATESPATEPPAAAQPVVTAASDPATAKVPLDQTLAVGSGGDAVKMVQQRLVDLAFDPGPVDGQFGPATQSAVWAFQ